MILMNFSKETNFKETEIGKFPVEWTVEKIGQIAKTEAGGTPSTSVREYWGGDVPWINSGELRNGLIDKPSKYITKLGLESSAARLLPPNTVLIALTGATTGVVGYLSFECATNQSVVGILPNPESFVPKFLFYYLAHNRKRVLMYNVGSAQPHINKKIVDDFLIVLPKIPEQKAIVEVLGVIDSAINVADRIISKTELLNKGLMQQLLTLGLGHKEYKNTPIGKAPASWETTNLGEILIDIKYGTSAKAGNEVKGYPVLGIPNVIGGKLNQINLRYADLSESEKRSLTLEEGDILLVRTNANPDYIGRCALFENLRGIWLYASYLIRIRPDKRRVSPAFLVKFLQSEKGRKQFLSMARTSAGNYNINSQEIRRIILNLPKLPEQLGEQKKITEILSATDNKLEFEVAEREKLLKLKKGLMDLLLTGKVRIRVD